MKAIFFPNAAALRSWFERHHATARELELGFYKKGTGHPSVTWPEAVDEALCFGWIDGVRHGIDARRYRNRLTPRKPTSTWSLVNIRRMKALIRAGRATPAGKQAFALRRADKSGVYAFERRREAKLPPAQQRRLKDDAAAWAYFHQQAPWYRRTAVHWVVSAKKEETRARRLEVLIASCRAGRPIPPLTRAVGKS